MNKPTISVPVSQKVDWVTITDDCIIIRTPAHHVTLVFAGPEHLADFLTHFGEAWARWDHGDDEPAITVLQKTLPF